MIAWWVAVILFFVGVGTGIFFSALMIANGRSDSHDE